MKLYMVESSNIDAIGWENNVLRVLFKSGNSFDYLNVSKEIFEEMLKAESKGSFFHRKIKSNYVGFLTNYEDTENNS